MDEPRGYCLDIIGGEGVNAPLDKGLQAHTCYNYSGRLVEDQSFDPVLIENGKFFINYFNVCMAAESLNEGVGVGLEKCGNSSKQGFILQSNGNIVTKVRQHLCLTVGSSKGASGDTAEHLMRPLSLEACSDDLKRYQTWKVQSL